MKLRMRPEGTRRLKGKACSLFYTFLVVLARFMKVCRGEQRSSTRQNRSSFKNGEKTWKCLGWREGLLGGRHRSNPAIPSQQSFGEASDIDLKGVQHG